jgi:hypothetical protein
VNLVSASYRKWTCVNLIKGGRGRARPPDRERGRRVRRDLIDVSRRFAGVHRVGREGINFG